MFTTLATVECDKSSIYVVAVLVGRVDLTMATDWLLVLAPEKSLRRDNVCFTRDGLLLRLHGLESKTKEEEEGDEMGTIMNHFLERLLMGCYSEHLLERLLMGCYNQFLCQELVMSTCRYISQFWGHYCLILQGKCIACQGSSSYLLDVLFGDGGLDR